MNTKDEKQLVELLRKLEPGFYPLEIFIEFARLNVLSIIEFVPLRMNGDEVEVLLIKRSSDDVLFAGELHTPGTVIRPGDNEANSYLAFDRILKDELQGAAFSDPHYVGSILHKSRRGSEHAQVYWIEPKGETAIGEWYSVNHLPESFMHSQEKFVQQATASFLKQKRS